MRIVETTSKLVVLASLVVTLTGCFAQQEDCDTAKTEEPEETSSQLVIKAQTHPEPAKEISIAGEVFELDASTDYTSYGRIWHYGGRHMLNGQMYDIFYSDDGYFDYGCIVQGEYTSGAPCLLA